MSKAKLFVSLMLAFALLSAQVSTVLAAPPQQNPEPITGTVNSITLETDSAGVTTVLVTLTDDTGAQQTVRLSVDTAVSLNLVTLDEAGNPVVNDAAVGGSVTIDPGTVIADEEAAQHPVGSALADFFSSLLGVDYDTIMSVHEEGVGFGVIAQALWLTNALDGDAELFAMIIDAKQSGDYSAIVLPDGSSPQNWGQFRKALLDHKQNLGQIMSGHASNGTEETPTTGSASPDNGNGHGNGGNGQGGGNGHGNNGQGHGNGQGQGHKP
jgi:hypothetical protein